LWFAETVYQQSAHLEKRVSVFLIAQVVSFNTKVMTEAAESFECFGSRDLVRAETQPLSPLHRLACDQQHSSEMGGSQRVDE
jgi:hypothetical protein